ncbi:MAG TPA: hypothetical protein VF173_12505 [Thermoanaerobaculia bacterium]|nr:hypothetical protein [Thermoanaerobaculia bacterium]
MKYAVALSIMFFVLGCAQINKLPIASATMTKAEVELDVFSGRPNPTWSLSTNSLDALSEWLVKLPRGRAEELPNHLGYRGIKVSFEYPDGSNDEVFVFGGIVRKHAGDSSDYFVDSGRALERWLLDTGKSKIPTEVYKASISSFP